MAATLQEILLAPGTQPQVITDCQTLIEQEVSATSGLSGAAVRLAYKTVNAVRPGYLRRAVKSLLPDIAGALQPYWADFSSCGGAEFGDYLAKHGKEVSQALLSVTDARAAAARRPAVVKAYNSVRGSAARHVEAALPRVGDLVQKHAAAG